MPQPDRSHGRGTRRKRRLVLSCLSLVSLLYLITGLYTVDPGERVLVRRFGKALPELRMPGLCLGLPYGLDQITRLRMSEGKRVGVGTRLVDRSLGRRVDSLRSEGLTGDKNLVRFSAIVQYQIQDAQEFCFAVADVSSLVRNTAAAELSRIVSTMTVDDVLTLQRAKIQDHVLAASQSALDRYGAGVRLTSVLLEEVAPPEEVVEAFRDVVSARGDKQRLCNEAHGYANRLIPKARGEANQLTHSARAEAEGLIERARGEAASFAKMAQQYALSREVTARRLILETMESVLPRLKKVVVGASENPFDLKILETTE